MSTEDQIEYHCDRAVAERALARDAASAPAARAHLTLSELHLERMRSLSEAIVPRMEPVS